MSRLFEVVERMVMAIVGDKLDYRALYPCKVLLQHADGTLDLQPDDERVGRKQGLTHVPLRYGSPGWRAKVPAGTRVLLGFEAGDPSRRFAALWEAGAVTELAFDGGQAAVGRVGDSVDIGMWQATPGSGGIAGLSVIPPGGGAPIVIPIAPAPHVQLTGQITSGNQKLLA